MRNVVIRLSFVCACACVPKQLYDDSFYPSTYCRPGGRLLGLRSHRADQRATRLFFFSNINTGVDTISALIFRIYL